VNNVIDAFDNRSGYIPTILIIITKYW